VADCTLTAGFSTYAERAPAGQTTFESPLVSFAYERGWRQGFAWAGFPGADSEFQTSEDYLAPRAGPSSVLVDLSCGSGLFTRRFAAGGRWGRVVAVDYSEAMLEQASTFLDEQAQKEGEPPCPVELVRADAARLPFATATIDALHAGAALHCWPSPLAAVAEIARVLKPGGRFVASTFLDQAAPIGELLGSDELVGPLSGVLQGTVNSNLPYRWWSEAELRELCAINGLATFERKRERQYIHFCVTKPE
jgi:ubiquinone/menaquinone biosynthesis C-methylase UbiE